jgi:hypothetical protein
MASFGRFGASALATSGVTWAGEEYITTSSPRLRQVPRTGMRREAQGGTPIAAVGALVIWSFGRAARHFLSRR